MGITQPFYKKLGLEFLFIVSFLLDFICYEIISDYPYLNANSPTTNTAYSKSGMLKVSSLTHHIQHLEFFSTGLFITSEKHLFNLVLLIV